MRMGGRSDGRKREGGVGEWCRYMMSICDGDCKARRGGNEVVCGGEKDSEIKDGGNVTMRYSCDGPARKEGRGEMNSG